MSEVIDCNWFLHAQKKAVYFTALHLQITYEKYNTQFPLPHICTTIARHFSFLFVLIRQALVKQIMLKNVSVKKLFSIFLLNDQHLKKVRNHQFQFFSHPCFLYMLIYLYK